MRNDLQWDQRAVYQRFHPILFDFRVWFSSSGCRQRLGGTDRRRHRQEIQTKHLWASFHALSHEDLVFTATPTSNPADGVRDEFNGTETPRDDVDVSGRSSLWTILISISIALIFITLKNCAPQNCLFIHLLFTYLTSQCIFIVPEDFVQDFWNNSSTGNVTASPAGTLIGRKSVWINPWSYSGVTLGGKSLSFLHQQQQWFTDKKRFFFKGLFVLFVVVLRWSIEWMTIIVIKHNNKLI